MTFLEPDQVERLASVIDPRYRVLVWFLVLTGVRFGELVALETQDLDMLRRTVNVSKTASEVRGRILVGPPKTAAGRRQISLPPVLGRRSGRAPWCSPNRNGFGVSGPRGWLPALDSLAKTSLGPGDQRRRYGGSQGPRSPTHSGGMADRCRRTSRCDYPPPGTRLSGNDPRSIRAPPSRIGRWCCNGPRSSPRGSCSPT